MMRLYLVLVYVILNNIIINSSGSSTSVFLPQVIVIMAYFGGLRHIELCDLTLEKIVSATTGVIVTHNRAKLWSDKLESKFLIPRVTTETGTNYAGIVETYLDFVRNDLGLVIVIYNYITDSHVNAP